MPDKVIDSDLIYGEIRTYDTRQALDVLPDYVFRKLYKRETGQLGQVDNPKQFFIDNLDNFTVCSFSLFGLMSQVLSNFFGDVPFPDRPGAMSEVWQERVRDYYVDGVEDTVYFVASTKATWVDTDLLGGDGSGKTEDRFEDSITIVVRN